jgi:hypothetical protein
VGETEHAIGHAVGESVYVHAAGGEAGVR